MLKTSFGEMEILLKSGNKPKVEFLRFLSEGRPHKHKEFESFFVMSGTGWVYSGDDLIEVKPGDLVTIPPDSAHWMKPGEQSVLEGLLWYHDTPLSIKQ